MMDSSMILYKGVVTHVIDPSNFWMRMGTETDFQEFEEYRVTLDKFYNEMGRKDSTSVGRLFQGHCVMVADTGQQENSPVYDGDKNTNFRWNRAKVSRISDDKVDVFYVDLGYTEIVNMSRVKNINQELFDYIPPQAVQLGLAGIKPLARSWTSRANAMFENKVLSREVLVSLVEYDESNKYGQVVIYLRREDGSWRSLTHEMLDEDLGLPTEPRAEESLSQESVHAALARAEQEQEMSSRSFGNDSDEADDVSEERSEATNQGQGESVPENSQSLLQEPILNHHQFPARADLMTSETYRRQNRSENPNVEVRGFDLASLKPSRFLSLSKMRKDKNKEHCQQMLAKLEQELEECEKDSSQDILGIDWDKTDLQIGKTGAFADVHESISQEIYKHTPYSSSPDDLVEFFPAGARGSQKKSSPSYPDIHQEQTEDTWRNGISQRPLTEMEDYEIQKKVSEILSNNKSEELDLLCVLINSIVEPDIDVPRDRLIAVFTAILETMIRDSDVDPVTAIGALETYLETYAFEEAIDTVMKSLKSSFVKLSRQSRGYHSAFADVLAALFIYADSWPRSTASKIREFAMTSVECWTAFNSQRVQGRESSVDSECLYLECVETFTDAVWKMLKLVFPERCSSLVNEMREKLLHDKTHRRVRVHLLDILLKLYTDIPASPQEKTSRRDVAVQTENIKGISDAGQGQMPSNQIMNCSPGKVLETPGRDQEYEGLDDLHDSYSYHDEDKDSELFSLEGDSDLDDSVGSVRYSPVYSDQTGQISASLTQRSPAEAGAPQSLHDRSDNEEQPDHSQKFSPSSQDNRCLNHTVGNSGSHSSQQTGSDALSSDTLESFLPNSSCQTLQVKKSVRESSVPDSSWQISTRFGLENILSKGQNSRDACAEGGSFKQEMSVDSSSDEAFISVSSPGNAEQLNLDSSDISQSTTNGDQKACIKYTLQELKALNTDLKETHASVGMVMDHCLVSKNAEDELKNEPAELKPSGPLDRYTGSGGSPVEISEGPKSNSAKWKSLAELLPPSTLKSSWKNFDTSVKPENQRLEVSSDACSASERTGSSPLDIAKGLISSTSHPQSEENLPCSSGKDEELSKEILNSDRASYAETKHFKNSQISEVPEWPENFFTGVEEVVGSRASLTYDHSEHHNTPAVSRNKKKKIKFRPVRKVLTDSDHQTETDNRNEGHQMIDQEVGGHIIHQPRLEASSVGSRKRPSVFADVRRDRLKVEPWVPGVRKCTLCGSKDHTIYDCPDEDEHRRVNNHNYI